MRNINQEVIELLKRNHKSVKVEENKLTLDINNVSITVLKDTRKFNIYLFHIDEEEMSESTIRPCQAIPYLYLSSLFNIK